MPQINLSEQLRLTEELRDFVVAKVRDAPIRSKREREVLAAMIEHYWRPDRKEEKRLAQTSKALQVEWKRDDMVAGGTSVAQAMETLAREYGHNSVPAFNKWLRRNRPRRRRSRLRDA